MENKNQEIRKIESDDKVTMLSERIAKAGQLQSSEFVLETRNFHLIKNVDKNVYSQMIGMVLAKAMNLAGFKKKVDNIHKSDINKMLLSKYKNISLEEIDKAFEIDRYSPDPIKHYDLFNATYVSKVLEEYFKWKAEKKPKKNTAKSLEPKKYSPEELIKLREQTIRNIFEKVQSHGFDRDAHTIYECVDAPNKKNKEYKKRLFNSEAKKYYARSKKDDPKIGPYDEFYKRAQNNKYLPNRCKSIIVSDYLSKFTEDFEIFKSKIKNKIQKNGKSK